MITPEINLHAAPREDLRKGTTNEFRANGRLPGIISVAGKPSINISVDEKSFLKEYIRGDVLARLVSLDIEGVGKHTVLVKNVQIHPVTDKPLHLDFVSVEGKDSVVVPVGVKCINHEKCPGIKRGGTLNMVRRTVMLRCHTANIPNTITVDLDGRRIGESIHISAIALPENCTPVIQDRDFTVCSIAGKGGKAQKEETDEDAAVEAVAAA